MIGRNRGTKNVSTVKEKKTTGSRVTTTNSNNRTRTTATDRANSRAARGTGISPTVARNTGGNQATTNRTTRSSVTTNTRTTANNRAVRNNNSGMGLGGIVASAVAATVANQVVNNVMDQASTTQTRRTPVRDIQHIREVTGASLSEAKRAYDDNNQNVEAAIFALTGQSVNQHASRPQQSMVMIACNSCRTENPQHVKFCSNCGNDMQLGVNEQPTVSQVEQPTEPLICSGCKANLTGVTGNVCLYCRTAFR